MRFTRCTRAVLLAVLLVASLIVSERPAAAQGRDSLLNGAVIGAAAGAGFGVFFAHAVRDSDLTVGQYAYGAVVFGAIGAGIGLGVDALIGRSAKQTATSPRLVFAPAVGRVKGVAVRWSW
jgi:hypothetical protein